MFTRACKTAWRDDYYCVNNRLVIELAADNMSRPFVIRCMNELNMQLLWHCKSVEKDAMLYFCIYIVVTQLPVIATNRWIIEIIHRDNFSSAYIRTVWGVTILIPNRGRDFAFSICFPIIPTVFCSILNQTAAFWFLIKYFIYFSNALYPRASFYSQY